MLTVLSPVATAILNAKNSDAVRRLSLEKKAIPTLDYFGSTTIVGTIETLLTALSCQENTSTWSEMRDVASKGHPIWSPLVENWLNGNGNGLGSDIHGIRNLEFYRIKDRSDQTSDKQKLFQERFVRSLKENGFPSKFSYALAGAFSEMTDNVVQHSEQNGKDFSGIAGYHIEKDYMAFVVGDLGDGILNTLRTNPEWNRLSSSHAAIEATVLNGASRRIGMGAGTGFKELFKALVDRNALIRLRSADAVMTIEDAANTRNGIQTASPNLSGTQISVCCCIGSQADERSISFHLQ